MKWAGTLAVATAAVCLASAQGACEPGFIDFGDSSTSQCVYFVRAHNTWHVTRDSCKLVNADLAKLTGNLHQKVMQYIISQPDLKDECFWAGGTDETLEGRWRWISDGSDIPLGTPHWYQCHRKDEPDGGNDENYQCLYKPDFYWHSCTGEEKFFGVCLAK